MNPIKNCLKTLLLLVCALAAVNVAAEEKSGALSADESGALGATRTVITAEVVYAATYKKGYSPDLLVLGEGATGTVPSADHAGLVAKELAEGKWANYLFNYKPGPKAKDGNITAYTLTVRPVKWCKDVLSYLTDQTEVIHWTRENRAATAKDPTVDSLPGSK